MTDANFRKMVADVVLDGECLSCHRDGYEPNTACENHEPEIMTIDDAFETLANIVGHARVKKALHGC